MIHLIKQELVNICSQIISEDLTIEEWREIESDDQFQNKHYIGGFDATEDEFCFSVFISNEEYWFQFSLDDAMLIANGKLNEIVVRPAEK